MRADSGETVCEPCPYSAGNRRPGAFLLAAVGFAWVKLGFDYRVESVTRLAMTLSVPCLIFTALMQTEIDTGSADRASRWRPSWPTGLVTVARCSVVVDAGRLDTRTYLAPLIFGNTGNLGLPLALFAFGETGLGYAVVVFAIMAIIVVHLRGLAGGGRRVAGARGARTDGLRDAAGRAVPVAGLADAGLG